MKSYEEIMQMVYKHYPVLPDEAECMQLRDQRNGLRDNYRKRLEQNNHEQGSKDTIRAEERA